MRTALFIIACMALVLPALAEMPKNITIAKVRPAVVEITREPVKAPRHLVRQVMPDCRFDRQLAYIQEMNEVANGLFAHDWDIDPTGAAMTDSKFSFFHEDVGIPAHCLVRVAFEVDGETGWGLLLHTYRQDFVLSAAVREDGISEGVPHWHDWVFAPFVTKIEDLGTGSMVSVY